MNMLSTLARAAVASLVALAIAGGSAWAGSDRKPLVLGDDGQREQLQSGDRLVDAAGTPYGSGGGSPGGSSGQVQYNNAGSFGGFTLSGDCTLVTSTGVVTCTKTSGTSLGYFATGTDAANLTGTVGVSRFNGGTGASSSTFLRGDGTWAAAGGTVTTTGSPTSGNLAKFSGSTSITNGDLSGDCATSGALAITCTKTSGSVFAASATTDATNANNISSGTLGSGRLPTSSAITWSGKQTLSGGADVTPETTPTTTAVGYLGAPVNTQNGTYSLALTDDGGVVYHTSGSAHTYTIPANASVAFPVGTVIIILNENGGGNITLAITSDTLRWGSTTGSRTIAANGSATLIKVTSTLWRLLGDGIT